MNLRKNNHPDTMEVRTQASMKMTALPGIPLVRHGDDLVSLILKSLKQIKLRLVDGDILVITQKIVSKSEGRYVRITDVNPSKRAYQLAKSTGKDPRLVELILSESRSIIRYRHGIIVTENRHGLILANAGIDQSNVEKDGDAEQVLLLPVDPDKSAGIIRNQLRQKIHVKVGVIINDSLGRAWRNGTIGTAIGVSGLTALLDLRGQLDLFGEPLKVSEESIADEMSSAASLLQGQGAEGRPVVLVQGYSNPSSPSAASVLIRPKEKDLFR